MKRLLPLLAFGMILVVEVLATVHSFTRDGIEEVAAGSDLRAFLTTADMLKAGDAEALYDLDLQFAYQQRRFPQLQHPHALLVFAHPPFVAAAVGFLGGVPTHTAYWMGLGLNGVALVVALLLVSRVLREHDAFSRTVLLAGVVSFLPVWPNLWLGQLSCWLLLAILVGWLAFRTNRDLLAGLSLSLLVCKPYLLVVPVLFLVIQRRHRALAGVGLGICLAFLLSLMVAGTHGILAWLELGRHLMGAGDVYGIHPRHMYTLRSGIHVLMQTDAFAPVRLPWLLGSVAGLIALAWYWRNPIESGAFRLQLGVAVAAALVIAPHAYQHDLVLAVPLAIGVSAAALEGLPSRWAVATLATAALLWFSPWLVGDWIPPAAVVFVLVGLAGLGVQVSRRAAPASAPELDAGSPPGLTARA
jgi:hypothetical protein